MAPLWIHWSPISSYIINEENSLTTNQKVEHNSKLIQKFILRSISKIFKTEFKAKLCTLMFIATLSAKTIGRIQISITCWVYEHKHKRSLSFLTRTKYGYMLLHWRKNSAKWKKKKYGKCYKLYNFIISVSRIGISIESESKLTVSRGWGHCLIWSDWGIVMDFFLRN